jgi:hypothetical protein
MRRFALKTLERAMNSSYRADTAAAVGNSRVIWVHHCLYLCGVTDMPSGVRQRNAGGSFPLAVVVGDDLNMIVLPDSDATVRDGVSARNNEISARDGLRIGGAQIDADGYVRHQLRDFCGCRMSVRAYVRIRRPPWATVAFLDKLFHVVHGKQPRSVTETGNRGQNCGCAQPTSPPIRKDWYGYVVGERINPKYCAS